MGFPKSITGVLNIPILQTTVIQSETVDSKTFKCSKTGSQFEIGSGQVGFYKNSSNDLQFVMGNSVSSRPRILSSGILSCANLASTNITVQNLLDLP